MANYYNTCPRCGARVDHGEVCRCDSAAGTSLAAVSALSVIRIEEKPTLAEQAREIDRALWLAAREYRAAKDARRRKRRGKR